MALQPDSIGFITYYATRGLNYRVPAAPQFETLDVAYLGTVVLDLAGQIAANSPVAVRAAKRAIRHGWGVSLEAGLDIEDAAWRTAALSADRREGIAAFVEKRKPAWPGQ